MTNALASRMARAAVPLAEALAALPLARYEIVLRAETEAALPPFPGAMLRGAFGYALKRAVCAMPHGDCGKCMLAARCVYPHTFETRWAQPSTQADAPHPFVLQSPVFPRGQRDRETERGKDRETERLSDPDSALRTPHSALAGQHHLPVGGELTFGFTLMGRAIESLPYFVYAWHELAQRGLTERRHRFTLAAVNAIAPDATSQPLYQSATQQLAANEQRTYTLNDYVTARVSRGMRDEGGGMRDEDESTQGTVGERNVAPSSLIPHPLSLRLRFLTPTRIKVNGQLQWRTDFPLLARNLLRRVTLAARAHGATNDVRLETDELWARAATITNCDEYLRWWDYGRYSTRQQTALKLGGFVGNVGFRGAALPDFLPLLAAGEMLGVGNATAFGLGQYRVKAIGQTGASDNSPDFRALA